MPDIEIHSGEGSVLPGVPDEIRNKVIEDLKEDIRTAGMLRFTIPGQPVPKGRPRLGRNGATYTPERTKNAELAVLGAFRRGIVGFGPPRTARYRLSCMFHVKRDDADLDNLVKLVMDGLQGVVWVNDSQVKAFGECGIMLDRDNPRTEVVIEEL